MFTFPKQLFLFLICLTTNFSHTSFSSLLSSVRIKASSPTIKQTFNFPSSTQIKPMKSEYNFPRITSRYERWPQAFVQLRDLAYGKYNSVNTAFAPFIGKGIAEQELQRFPKQYINVPYVKKPVLYQHGWQVTNRTLLNTVIEKTKNPEVYDIDEQKDLVEIALNKGADPLYSPAIESNSPGYDAELQGNALEVAIKWQNIGALEALINYLDKQDLLENLEPKLKSQLNEALYKALRNASDDQKTRIQNLITKLETKKIEDYEALD